VDITFHIASAGGSVNSNATVCSGSNSGTLNLSGHTGSVVKWQLSTDGGSNFSDIANVTTTQNYSNLTQTTIYRAVIKSGICAEVNSSTSTITVDAVSAGGSVSGSTTVCSGSNSGSLSLSGHTGDVQKWQYSTDGGSNYMDITTAPRPR
jgi:hypothetical protein